MPIEFCDKMSQVMRDRSLAGGNPGWSHINSDAKRRSRPEKYFIDSLERVAFPWQTAEKMPFGRYHLDFAVPELNVDIEVDGCQHLRPEATEHDEVRNQFLTASGWHVVRITAKEVLSNSDAAVIRVAESILSLPATPSVLYL